MMKYEDIIVKNNDQIPTDFKEVEKILNDLGEMWLVKNSLYFGKIENPGELKIVKIDVNKDTFLETVISYTNKYVTILVKDDVIVDTCYSEASRSIVDIYLLLKTYFPDTTLQEVYDSVLGNENCVFQYCGTIQRVVYYLVCQYDFECLYDDDDNCIEEFEATDELGNRVFKQFFLTGNYSNYEINGVEYKLNQYD